MSVIYIGVDDIIALINLPIKDFMKNILGTFNLFIDFE